MIKTKVIETMSGILHDEQVNLRLCHHTICFIDLYFLTIKTRTKLR